MTTEKEKNYKDLIEQVEKLKQEVESEAAAEQDEEKKVIDLDGLRAAFVVGIDKDNKMVFSVGGYESKELITLAGLHYYAGKQIDLIHGDVTMSGDRLIKEVGQATGQIFRVLTQPPAEAVAPVVEVGDSKEPEPPVETPEAAE